MRIYDNHMLPKITVKLDKIFQVPFSSNVVLSAASGNRRLLLKYLIIPDQTCQQIINNYTVKKEATQRISK